MVGCEAKPNIDSYPYDMHAYENQGFTISKVLILKKPDPNQHLVAEEQYILTSDFDAFHEAFDIQWTYKPYYFQPDQTFYDNHSFEYTIVVYYGHEYPGVILHIYSDYVVRYGQPFFKLNASKLDKLMIYLQSLTYEPFVTTFNG